MPNSRNIWDQIKPDSIRDDYQDTYVLWLKDTFFNSVNYFQVNKNLDYVTNYDVLIKDYDASKKIIASKNIISYPYDNFQFDTGDYIHWLYNGSLSTWLIIASDKQYTYNFNGRMQKCKNTLTWYDSDNNEISYPCIIEDNFSNNEFSFYKHMIVSEGDINVVVQANADTITLGNNDRFVFDGQSFRVKSYDNFVSQDIIVFTMRKDNIAYDDTTIADVSKNDYSLVIDQSNFSQIVGYTSQLSSTITLNNDVVSKDVTWSSSDETKVTVDGSGNISLIAAGSVTITCSMDDNTSINDTIIITCVAVLPVNKVVLFSPNIDILKQGKTQEFTVYKYTDDVAQVDTFTITGSGVSTDYYTLTATDGNTFTIENLKVNYDDDLTITCVSLVDGTTGTLTIQLKGMW